MAVGPLVTLKDCTVQLLMNDYTEGNENGFIQIKKVKWLFQLIIADYIHFKVYNEWRHPYF